MECIKPVQGPKEEVPKESLSKIRIELENDGTYSQRNEDGNVKVLEKVSVTLSDCLACSGCITSAESVLISQQGPDELIRILENNRIRKESIIGEEMEICIVTLGVQAVLSLAHKCGTHPQLAAEQLAGFFVELGADKVTMATLGENFSLIESQKEFMRAFESNRQSLPILTGVCPGWVCYGEKLHPQSLPFISQVKSPQQIMGSLIKNVYGPRENFSPDQITHITLMSCFDRKLEASRLDFSLPDYRTKEVDHVITAIEVEELLQRFGKSLLQFIPKKLDNLFYNDGGSIVKSHLGSGSGGYAEFVLRSMSQRLYGRELKEVIWKQGRNSDIWESTLNDESGKSVLKFGIATGFRNIQTIVRKLKSKVMAAQLPHYIEVMACPTGCLNGGAQIRGDNETLVSRDLALKLEEDYHSLPLEKESDEVIDLYDVLGSQDSQFFQHLFYTNFHSVEKSDGLLGQSVRW